MAKATPVVYLLHGDDEFAITQFVSELGGKLGDYSVAAMNINRLDGRSFNLDDLLSIASAMPFLAKRRLVVLTHPLARLNSQASRQRFLENLEKIPPTTALLLVEYRPLIDEKSRRRGTVHWLESWAVEMGERAYVKAFTLPKGPAMARWIQDRVGSYEGQITIQAAGLLSSLVGDDPRLADQEIQKLLAFVNYRRPIEPEDVETLTADTGMGDIFAMVDALGNQDGRRALGMLHRLLSEQDAIPIFSMVVRQFRLLLLAREVLERGGREGDVSRELKVHPFVAEKLVSQARHFHIPILETVYHRLLDLDEAMKTGLIEGSLALDTLVAEFTSQRR